MFIQQLRCGHLFPYTSVEIVAVHQKLFMGCWTLTPQLLEDEDNDVNEGENFKKREPNIDWNC